MQTIGITKFAEGRHFDPTFKGTRVIGMAPEELVALANKAMDEGAELVDGYKPYCKHLFVRNPSDTLCGVARITDENRHLLVDGYRARREGELKVLTRWFEGLEAPRAEWLDIVLYTRAQLEEEAGDATGIERDVPDANWGIVSINAEPEPAETPLNPITQMRNALGKEQGGSGAELDVPEYNRAVEFWEHHATVG